MAIELIPFTPIGNTIRNTPDAILRMARLDLSVVQTFEVEEALILAADEVAFDSPEDTDNARSNRSENLRKGAEAYLAVSALYEIIATHALHTTPPLRILTTLNISAGADFPTPDIILRVFQTTADRYRKRGEKLLAKIRPITATIMAGDPIEDE